MDEPLIPAHPAGIRECPHRPAHLARPLQNIQGGGGKEKAGKLWSPMHSSRGQAAGGY